MFTEGDVRIWTRAMFANDTILFYGPHQTYGLYKKLNGQVVRFRVPTSDARKPCRRKIISRRIYTDFTGNPTLRSLSAMQLLAGINALGPRPEVYQANRPRRFHRLMRSVDGLTGQ